MLFISQEVPRLVQERPGMNSEHPSIVGLSTKGRCTLLCTLLQGHGLIFSVDLPSTIHVPTRSAKLRKARQSLRYPALCCHPGTRLLLSSHPTMKAYIFRLESYQEKCRHQTFYAIESWKKISKRPVFLGPVIRVDHDSAWPQRGGICIVLRLSHAQYDGIQLGSYCELP